jgi:transposase
MKPWTGAQSAFAVKAFYKNGNSFVIAQRVFRREFEIHRNRAVPSAHAIKAWVRNFEATGSTLKKKGGSVKTERTPENIAVMREATERSPHRSARRHSVSLGLSEATVRRILHTPHSSGVQTSNSARSQTNSCVDASMSNE